MLVSVVAHAALWWLVRDALLPPRTSTPAATPLTGETVEFSIALPAPDPGSGSGEAKREGRASSVKPTPQPSPTPAAENTAPASTALGSSIVEVDVGGADPDPLPQKGASAPPAAAAGPATATQVDDAALVHARLAEAARRCYPAAARRFRQRGTVTLSFCGDASGSVINAAVKESSGAALLDDSALHCVLAAAAPLPPEAASHCYAVPVRFDAQ